jgi:hypothetical protein
MTLHARIRSVLHLQCGKHSNSKSSYGKGHLMQRPLSPSRAPGMQGMQVKGLTRSGSARQQGEMEEAEEESSDLATTTRPTRSGGQEQEQEQEQEHGRQPRAPIIPAGGIKASWPCEVLTSGACQLLAVADSTGMNACLQLARTQLRQASAAPGGCLPPIPAIFAADVGRDVGRGVCVCDKKPGVCSIANVGPRGGASCPPPDACAVSGDGVGGVRRRRWSWRYARETAGCAVAASLCYISRVVGHLSESLSCLSRDEGACRERRKQGGGGGGEGWGEAAGGQGGEGSGYCKAEGEGGRPEGRGQGGRGPLQLDLNVVFKSVVIVSNVVLLVILVAASTLRRRDCTVCAWVSGVLLANLADVLSALLSLLLTKLVCPGLLTNLWSPSSFLLTNLVCPGLVLAMDKLPAELVLAMDKLPAVLAMDKLPAELGCYCLVVSLEGLIWATLAVFHLRRLLLKQSDLVVALAVSSACWSYLAWLLLLPALYLELLGPHLHAVLGVLLTVVVQTGCYRLLVNLLDTHMLRPQRHHPSDGGMGRSPSREAGVRGGCGGGAVLTPELLAIYSCLVSSHLHTAPPRHPSAPLRHPSASAPPHAPSASAGTLLSSLARSQQPSGDEFAAQQQPSAQAPPPSATDTDTSPTHLIINTSSSSSSGGGGAAEGCPLAQALSPSQFR